MAITFPSASSATAPTAGLGEASPIQGRASSTARRSAEEKTVDDEEGMDNDDL